MLFIKDKQYAKKMLMLALPVAMQSVLQSSILNFADQLMVGQLGSANVAGIGIASKFVSIFSVVVAAISTAITIIISQNIGQNDESDINEGCWTGVLSALALGVTLGSVGCQPEVEVLEGDVPYYAETVPSEADDSFVTEGEPTEEYESNTEEVVMGIMPVPTEEEILWGDFEYDKLPDNE